MMKTSFLKVLAAALFSVVLVSCGSVKKSHEFSPSRGFQLGSSKWINGEVFQTINKHQALVSLYSSSVDRPLVYIVMPDSSKEYYFDKLAIRGDYIFIGTHQYKTVNRDFDQFKTVPVFISKKFYVPGMEWDDWYEKIKTTEPTSI